MVMASDAGYQLLYLFVLNLNKSVMVGNPALLINAIWHSVCMNLHFRRGAVSPGHEPGDSARKIYLLLSALQLHVNLLN